MKLRYSVSLLLAGGALAVAAQPNLPSGNSSYAPGESYPVHQSTWFTPPAIGEANTTWDFSTLVTSASATVQYVAPVAGAPSGATVSEVQAPTVHAHYKATAAAFQQMGLTSPQATLTCSDPINVFVYPFTYNSTATDTYACTGNTMGEAFTRTGTMQHEGASWGTLVLPYGTFTNVLMIQIEQHHEDVFTSDPDWPIEYHAYMQMFVKPGVKMPLLANYELQNVPGQLLFFSRLLDESAVGVDEAMQHAIGVDLMPNPATDRVEVLFGVDGGRKLTIEVIDANGRVVLADARPSMVSGIQREVLDVSGLDAGLYTVRITDETGAMGVKRLVVQ